MEKNERAKNMKKRLTIQDRLDILQSLNSGVSGSSLAKKYNVSSSAISKIKINKTNILTSEQTIKEHNGSLKRKRAPSVENTRLEQALYSWFVQKRNRGDPMSGPILKEKALQLNEELQGSASFKATDGYLARFKQRHGIRSIGVQRDKESSADKETGTTFCEEFSEIVIKEEYTMDQISNVDETDVDENNITDGTNVDENNITDETNVDENNISDEPEIDNTEQPKPTPKEAREALDKFQAWFQSRWEFDEDFRNNFFDRQTAVKEALTAGIEL